MVRNNSEYNYWIFQKKIEIHSKANKLLFKYIEPKPSIKLSGGDISLEEQVSTFFWKFWHNERVKNYN